MNDPKDITLELLSKTALQLAALKSKYPPGPSEVEEAYNFLELCQHTLKAMSEKQRAREEFERKLASEGIPTSEALKEITGSNSNLSHYRKRFFKFVNDGGPFRRYAEDFKNKIPLDLIPDLKRDYQKWNEYQKTLEAKKKGLKSQEPNEDARKRIDLAPMISMLPDSKQSAKKSS